MKTAAMGAALATYLHAKVSWPLESVVLGRDYSQVQSQRQTLISNTQPNEAGKSAPLIGGVVVNPLNSTILVCDVRHACVRVLDAATLQLQHTIGGKGGNPGKFLEPHCIAIHVTGTIAISDAKVNRIQVFSIHHTLLAHFGKFGSEKGQFNHILGLAFTPDGHIAVADSGNHRVVVVATTGHVMAVIGAFGINPGEFQSPVALALNRCGDLFVCDRDNHRIQVFGARSFRLQTLWGSSTTMQHPSSIAVGCEDDGDIVVCDDTRVFVFSQVGLLSHVLAIPDVHGVCFDRQQLVLTQSPNCLHLCTPYRLVSTGPWMAKIPTRVFHQVMSFLSYLDSMSLRQTNKYYHRVTKARRDAWLLHPFVPGTPGVIRYGKVVAPATGLLAVHDLYSKWGDHVNATIALHDRHGLDFDTSFNGAICEYFGPMFWFQHEPALRTMFFFYASSSDPRTKAKLLLRQDFVELVTVLLEIQANYLQWSQSRPFCHVAVPATRCAHVHRLERLEQTQAYQLDKLMLKLKAMI
ncbi:hypothetical protein H310_00932 [Aphanomyces invadans]|uniref:F-box domain-containing protein n=1 Tax=Aphanomyces invadans TaxID=157072 RepID=A0A024UR40_9STRA|nr:hypothetical protein H310_00932 [Aphanomyces invadans]ETW08322.1 hypothetical protein H310_00932 [Aphanomyces invadans]|eukprot:XP_008862127.1 hypothetical protein H310_00932 [Aphanomyces invadans]